MDQHHITSIERQKNRPRYNIYINEEFAFAIHEDILIKFRLAKGKEMDPKDVTDILRAEEKHRAEQYALRYISFRPRTSHEVFEYLQKKGFEEDDCRVIISSCAEKGYINDQAYASMWIEERKRLKPRGRHLLRQELSQRGIKDEMVDEALAEQLSSEEEKQIIIQLIQKKYEGQFFSTLFDMKKKIIPYLQRKGFPLNVILSALHEVKDKYVGDSFEDEHDY